MIVVYEEMGIDEKGRDYVKHRETHRPSREDKIKTKMFVKEHKLAFKKIALEMKLLKKKLEEQTAYKETKNKIIKFIEHISRSKAQDTLSDFEGHVLDEEKFFENEFNQTKNGYIDLWKSMFNEDLEEEELDNVKD